MTMSYTFGFGKDIAKDAKDGLGLKPTSEAAPTMNGGF